VDDISVREAEVLASVGEGLTNAQIASRLHLSVRTVESHVSALLRKTGSADRRELAALTTRSRSSHGVPVLDQGMVLHRSLIGRDDDLAAVSELLDRSALVTIVAAGGSGKTALAREVAGTRRSVFVDLVTLPVGAGVDLVSSAVAQALGVDEGDAVDLVSGAIRQLRAAPTLLVLDNCEHLLDGVAALAVRVTSAVSGCVLATSREPLSIPGEVVHRLGPLDTDAAVELFVERAAVADPSAVLDRSAVADLCDHLDRLPLAIELAAARLAVFDFADLQARLDRSLDLLVGGSRVTERHRSVRNALNWSHDLLTPAEATVHRRLSVLSAPADLATIEAVVGEVSGADVAAVVGRLCDASLLVRSGKSYRQLDLVHSDARERLEASRELPAVVDRLVGWAGGRVVAGEIDANVMGALDLAVPRADDSVSEFVEALVDQLMDHERWTEAGAVLEHLGRARSESSIVRRAAELALGRWRGVEAQRLYELAAVVAREQGDERGLADALAGIVELETRWSGVVEGGRSLDELRSLAAEVARVAASHPHDVELGALSISATAWADGAEVELEVLDRMEAEGVSAVVLSGLHDAAIARHQDDGRNDLVREISERRLRLLPALVGHGRPYLERCDALAMVAESNMRTGRFSAALTAAVELERATPMFDVRWGAITREAAVRYFMGDFDGCFALVREARSGWEANGELAAGYLALGFASAGAIAGYRGDDEESNEWFRIVERWIRPTVRGSGGLRNFAADVFLHRGRIDAAREICELEPADVAGASRSLYAAIRAEAHGGRALDDAVEWVAADPFALGILQRAMGELDGALATFVAIGARYQAARTRLAMGGTEADAGRAVYRELQLVIPG
jgi:predicted ATPase/DNA-binding CsgD family transcriptional regulator